MDLSTTAYQPQTTNKSVFVPDDNNDDQMDSYLTDNQDSIVTEAPQSDHKE